MMRVCEIVPRIHEEASGPTYTVPQLSIALASHGIDTSLACLDVGEPRHFEGVEQLRFKPDAMLERLGRSQQMKRWFEANAQKFSRDKGG